MAKLYETPTKIVFDDEDETTDALYIVAEADDGYLEFDSTHWSNVHGYVSALSPAEVQALSDFLQGWLQRRSEANGVEVEENV